MSTFVYVAATVILVIAAIVAVAFWPAVEAAWCEHVDLPEYEDRFGFEFGAIARQGQRAPVLEKEAHSPGQGFDPVTCPSCSMAS